MSALTLALIGVLLATAALRMARGHWMPVHAEHEPLDFAALTIAGIPIEELALTGHDRGFFAPAHGPMRWEDLGHVTNEGFRRTEAR